MSRLVAAVRQYRHCDGVALHAADGSWWLTLSPGQTIAYLPRRDRDTIESTTTFDVQLRLIDDPRAADLLDPPPRSTSSS